jgi:hypothetical protein
MVQTLVYVTWLAIYSVVCQEWTTFSRSAANQLTKQIGGLLR